MLKSFEPTRTHLAIFLTQITFLYGLSVLTDGHAARCSGKFLLGSFILKELSTSLQRSQPLILGKTGDFLSITFSPSEWHFQWRAGFLNFPPRNVAPPFLI